MYLDDILILSNEEDSFEDHLGKVKVVFSRLHKMGMKVNLMKTEFFKNELEYLGYLLTDFIHTSLPADRLPPPTIPEFGSIEDNLANLLPWGKYSYERLPMGIATSPESNE